MWSMRVTLDVSKFNGWSNAEAERSMRLMSVTLDVSRFNGWLNTSVSCQVIHTGTGDMRGVRIHGGVCCVKVCGASNVLRTQL